MGSRIWMNWLRLTAVLVELVDVTKQLWKLGTGHVCKTQMLYCSIFSLYSPS